MIPDFNDQGYLPPGVHPASLEEIESRFGVQSELRRVQMDSLRWLIELARKAGVKRLIINGSFVTQRLEPNDVDCALLTGLDFPFDQAAEREISDGLPFLQINLFEIEDFEYLVNVVYATDRHQVSKGVVEVLL